MDIKDLKQTKKALEDIKSLQDDIIKNTARYNKEGELGVKAARELNNLKETEANLLQKISKYDDSIKIKREQAKIARTTVGLTAKLNKLMASGTGEILKQYNLTESLEAANKGAQISKGEEQKGYNLVQEAQAAAVQEMKDGTFKAADFLNNLEEQFQGMSEEAQKAYGKMSVNLEDFAENAEKAGKSLENALSIDAKDLDGLQSMRDKAKQFSAIMTSPALLGAAALGLAVKFATDFAGKVLEIRQSLGTSVVESARLAGNMKLAGLNAKRFGGSLEQGEAAVTSLANEFGSLDAISASVSMGLGRITGQFGLSGDNAGKLLKTMQGINGASIETNLNTLETVGNLARAARVAPAAVLNDMAENSETFAKFAMKGGDNLAKAAIAARKLGLNLSTVDKIAESIMDIEGSIEREMEASMLIGRQMSLDRARQLVMEGDMIGVLAEVKRQAGGAAEFAKLDFIQRKSLAAAVGLEVSELAKLAAGEAEVAKIEAERSNNLAKNMAMGAAAGAGILAIVMALKAVLTSGFTIGKDGLDAAKGAATGLAIGAGIGAGAGAIASAAGMEKGGVVKKGGMAVVHKGEAFSGTRNEMGMGMGKTNILLKQLIKQNEVLMNRLTSRIGDIALSSAT